MSDNKEILNQPDIQKTCPNKTQTWYWWETTHYCQMNIGSSKTLHVWKSLYHKLANPGTAMLFFASLEKTPGGPGWRDIAFITYTEKT